MVQSFEIPESVTFYNEKYNGSITLWPLLEKFNLSIVYYTDDHKEYKREIALNDNQLDYLYKLLENRKKYISRTQSNLIFVYDYLMSEENIGKIFPSAKFVQETSISGYKLMQIIKKNYWNDSLEYIRYRLIEEKDESVFGLIYQISSDEFQSLHDKNDNLSSHKNFTQYKFYNEYEVEFFFTSFHFSEKFYPDDKNLTTIINKLNEIIIEQALKYSFPKVYINKLEKITSVSTII